MKKLISHLLYTITISFIILPSFASAETLSSPNFRLKTGTVNIGGGLKSSPSFKLSDSLGQISQGQFDSNGYRLRAGFQYLREILPFSFKVDSSSTSFSNSIPNVFNNSTTVLTISSGGAYGYSIKVIEDHPLTLSGGSVTIPNTACDPLLPCTITDAAPWTDSSSYGFGYNVSGDGVDQADFVNDTYFRPFPDNSKAENPVTIISQSKATGITTAKVNFRINVSPSQPSGAYDNNIQYIAIPAY